MKKYSVAIRTLGTSGDLLKRELQSLQRQTVRPQKVVIYIAEGYRRPSFTVADEQYIYVKKGMVAQAALDYDEIDTELILKLDDDVEFTKDDDVENLIKALEEEDYDVVVVDTFKNHKMSVGAKMYNKFTNFNFPRFWGQCAFKIHANGSFSYLNNPVNNVYITESGAGPCALWKKKSILAIHLKDELWLDTLGFSYGDDQVIFQKVVRNGGKMAAYFHSGIVHLDGKTSSGIYHRDVVKFQTRAMGQYLLWHRSIYSASTTLFRKMWCLSCLLIKVMWQIPVHCIAAVKFRSAKIPFYYLCGILKGMEFTKSKAYKSLPSYLLK